MSRSLEPQKQPNPAIKFLEWKSNDRAFSYWDKEKKENVFIDLPFKFMKLTEMHTVKGFHDNSQSGIYANEVKFIGNEILTVKAFKDGQIAKGLYKDIKGDILSAGGYYTKSVYIMTSDFEIWNIQMKGSVVSAWSDFSSEMRQRLNDEWLVVAESEDKKKGATNYSVPIFKSEIALSDKEWETAKEKFAEISEYFKNYFEKEIEQDSADKVDNEKKVEDREITDDGLPF